jgi:hypothetical protein
MGSADGFLVPKLCLGNAVVSATLLLRRRKHSFEDNYITKQSLGTRRTKDGGLESADP